MYPHFETIKGNVKRKTFIPLVVLGPHRLPNRKEKGKYQDSYLKYLFNVSYNSTVPIHRFIMGDCRVNHK